MNTVVVEQLETHLSFIFSLY